jgi:HK97 family phage prohead protease
MKRVARRAEPSVEERFAAGEIERRYSTLQTVSLDTDTRTFEGYASVFGSMNSYREIFLPGAFKRTLANPPLKRMPSMYLQHNHNNLIGKWLEMREDDRGLFVRGQFVDSDVGRHAMALVREKIATGLSIGFIPVDYRDENADNWEKRIRYISDADLYETSIVEIASDKQAGVTHVRSIRADMSVREVEDVLRSIPGLPRDVAKAMAGVWKPGKPRDAAAELTTQAEARDAQAITDLVTRMRAATADLRKRT